MPHAIEALHRNHDLRAALIRSGTTAVAGIAAVGHHGDFLAIADGQDFRDVLDASGLEHQGCCAPVQLPKIGEVCGYVTG